MTAAAVSSNQSVETYQGNTNLEQISDWLTKILVGAGLVELGNLGNSFQGLTSKLAAGGCLGNCGQLVAGSVIILYAIAGFGLAYLYARIYLALELRDAGKDRFPIESPLGQMKAAYLDFAQHHPREPMEAEFVRCPRRQVNNATAREWSAVGNCDNDAPTSPPRMGRRRRGPSATTTPKISWRRRARYSARQGRPSSWMPE